MTAPRFIRQFWHCRKCMTEWSAGKAPGQSPADYSRLEAGWSELGLQVRCQRHDINIIHIDFEGVQHRADLSERGDFGGFVDWPMFAFELGRAFAGQVVEETRGKKPN